MNSLQDLRKVFDDAGVEVTNFTGHSMDADGRTWGLVHENPVMDGQVLSPLDWKAYHKALRAKKPRPTPTSSQDAAIAKTLGIGL